MSELVIRTAVYTGAFDPITLGHLNVIERSSRLVERLVVGVGVNTGKRQLFSPQERAELVELATAHLPNVEVRPFSGLAVEFVRHCGARVMVRGVRPLTDIAFEFTMLMGNRELDPDMETIFLMADEQYTHVSSTLIKEITPLCSDEKLARFVPKVIIPTLRAKMAAAGPQSE